MAIQTTKGGQFCIIMSCPNNVIYIILKGSSFPFSSEADPGFYKRVGNLNQSSFKVSISHLSSEMVIV